MAIADLWGEGAVPTCPGRKLIQPDSARRDFFKAGATGLLLLKPQTVFGSAGQLRRGGWADRLRRPRQLDRRILCGVRRRAHCSPGRCDPRAPGCHASQLQDRSARAHLLWARKPIASSSHRKWTQWSIETPPYFHPGASARGCGCRQTRLSGQTRGRGCARLPQHPRERQTRPRASAAFWWISRRARSPFSRIPRSRIARGDIGKPVFAQVFLLCRPSPRPTNRSRAWTPVRRAC
jgi:hypothetical protein